tara:strand:- start:11 stop:160 length:150 start_codon:yes stop_codon:yes gene_type:complete
MIESNDGIAFFISLQILKHQKQMYDEILIDWSSKLYICGFSKNTDQGLS